MVTGLSKALQKKGHLVEIILPKYDCMQYDRIGDLKVLLKVMDMLCIIYWNFIDLVAHLMQALDAPVDSYFDGQLFKNKIWVGTVEGQTEFLSHFLENMFRFIYA